MAKKKRRKVDMKKVQKRAAQQHKNEGRGGFSVIDLPEDAEMYTPKKGKNAFDIIPYEVSAKNHPADVEPGDLWYNRDFHVHANVGPEDKRIICPAKTIGKPCPICEAYNEMRKDKEADEDVTKGLRPKHRQLFNVIDKKKGADGEIQVMEISHYLFGKALNEELTEGDEENGAFCDLEGGLTLKARFSEESGGGYTFLECSRIDFVSRKTDYKEDILESVFDLDAILIILSYEEIEKEFLGVSDDEDDDEDEKPKKKKKSSKKKKKEEPEEDDDDDSDDDSDDSDDSDSDDSDDSDSSDEDECVACEGSGKNTKGKKCRICKGSGTAPAEDDDDDGGDDEDDDDDDDEDEKPKKKKKSSGKKKKKKEPEPEEDDEDEDDDDDWDD